LLPPSLLPHPQKAVNRTTTIANLIFIKKSPGHEPV
jgi:hypothetical protein